MQETLQRVANLSSRPTTLGIHDLRERADLSSNQTGTLSEVLEFQTEVIYRLLQGPANPFRVAIPAYEQFTSNGTGGDTETFNLAGDVVDSPFAQAVDVWVGGDHYGRPDAVDYANDTIDVTDDGTDNTIHVWYISGEAANAKLEKSTPKAGTSSTQELYSGNLRLVNQTDQTEQPEYLTLTESQFHPFLPGEFILRLSVRAPYTVRFDSPTGDGAYPTNALLELPAEKFGGSVDGFGSVVSDHMG